MTDTRTARIAALREYRGALEAAASAADAADGLLPRLTDLPASFRQHNYGGDFEVRGAIRARIREVDAALDFLEDTDRRTPGGV